MWLEIEIALYALSCCTMLTTTYIASLKSIPDGYQEIGSGMVRNNTLVLKRITQIVCGAEFLVILMFDLNLKEFNPFRLILPSTWLLLLGFSRTIFKTPYQGGLYGTFLAIFLLLSGMMVSLLVNYQQTFMYATLVAGGLWILVGSWYHEGIENVCYSHIDVPRIHQQCLFSVDISLVESDNRCW
jgi:hypothetical protein